MKRQVPDGYRVRFRHVRPMQGPRGNAREPEPHMEPAPHGGKTIAEIINSEREVVATGVARCRTDESYVKRIGRAIAQERALFNFEHSRTPSTSGVGDDSPYARPQEDADPDTAPSAGD